MQETFQSKKWRNITISGKAGAGSTTLLKNLKEKLFGWTFFSGGEFMREYAIEHNLFLASNKSHHKATVYTDEFDREADGLMKKRLKNEHHLVIEADLAGFNAKDIPGVLKILLVCSDALRIDRIVNRDDITVEEAKRYLREREEENMAKWERLYGTRDFWNPNNYDVVIDTYTHGPTETVDEVLKVLGN